MKNSSEKKKKKAKSVKKKTSKTRRVSYHRQPEEMELNAWQIALRRQFAQQEEYVIENVGEQPVWSEFRVANPKVATAYRVALRAKEPGANFCSCPDFRTNTLGVCKHIEAVIHKLWHTRGMRQHFKKPYEAVHSSVFLHYGKERSIRLRIGSEAEEQLRSLAQPYFDESGILRPEAYRQFERFLESARQLSPAFRCYPDALEFILQKREDEQREQRIAAIAQQADGYLGQLLKVKLYPYQQEGALFAATSGRCLLADEMGLGKTLQAIAAAELWRKEFGISRVVIICPTSLKYQWKSEIEKFTDSSVQVVEGPPHHRRELYEQSEAFYLILTYNMAMYDAAHLQALEPNAIILDEAQRIKNWNTKISRAIKQLQTDYALVLTGTPLENKLEELYSIVQFVDQYCLGPLHTFLHRHQIKDEHGRVVGYRDLELIKEKLRTVMIRRTKKQVLQQLPARTDKQLFVPMTPAQQDYHKEFGDQVARLVAKWRRFNYLSEKDRQRLMINLNCMRMACNSTYLIDQKTRHDTKIMELMCILEEALAEEDTKVVIFSQWERMTRLIREELDERQIGFAYLHGGVPGSERGGLLDTFHNDPNCRVFLSTDAGGVGLNLQTASLVINMDLPWNPAVLEQRIGRVYRMGQLQPVSVINFVSAQTIEHRMLATLDFKASLAEGVLDDGEGFVFMGSERFKKFMEEVETITTTTGAEKEALSSVAEEADMEENIPGAGMEPKPDFMAEDDLPEPAPQPEQAPASRERQEQPQPSPAALVEMGGRFFSSLVQTLSDEKASRELVDSLVKKDESTGQAYLQIPVESKEMVQSALSLLGGLIKGMGQQ